MIDFGASINASQGRRDGLAFSAIVGQDELKRALLAVGANERLDGLLIRGEKGTAKSTAVRGLADLLPEQTVVADCPYGCPPDDPDGQCVDCRERADPPTAQRAVPLVTLPLGATRDRVVGTLSTAGALAGEHEFEPGLLARANRGILYVDEVNLLDDHLVDVLLDAAASGVNRVERDGVSVTHPAEFTLVGTMNPEEGDLRPQLRDRFALGATVTACEDVDRRVAIIDRALGRTAADSSESADSETDANGPDTASSHEGKTGDRQYRRRLREARDRLDGVDLPDEFAAEIAELCRDAGLDGHRGDIATARAARTFAALDGRSKVIEPDVRRAATLAIPHRLQSRPFEDAPDPDELLDERFGDGDDEEGGRGPDDQQTDDQQAEEGSQPADGDDANGSAEPGDSADEDSREREPDRDSSGPNAESGAAVETESRDAAGDEGDTDGHDADGCDADGCDADNGDEREATPVVPGQSRAAVGNASAPDIEVSEAVDAGAADGGKRAQARPTADGDGPRVRERRADDADDVDAAASVRAAAARGASSVDSRDLRRSVRRSDAGALVVFVVDASASMRSAMRAAKGTVMELLRGAYQQRDAVAFVAFAGDDAEVLLPPTDSVAHAARHLKDLPTGDRTPLSAALDAAGDVLDRADPAAGVVVLVTDGRANVASESPVAETREAAKRLDRRDPHVVVVDADADAPGLCDLIADETDGARVPLSALSADRIDAAAGAVRES
ncbi:VWA domain-containing protein [Halosimplex sp. TS25]|uniref:VWA domain-containing protein n=1 Tax=Halosimplex rarum TaxID=3396619 RepID=UPI0039E7FC4C